MTKGITQRAVGETIDEFLLIKQSIKGVTTTGNPFISLVLQDKSGDIEAKLWDTKEEQEKMFAAETIVRVGGEIHNYRGKNQLRIKSIRPAKPEENQSIADLMPSSEKSTEELSEEVMSYLFEMQNPQIQRITRHILKKYQHQFFTFPAATRNHHDYVSGLADHVVSMLQLGKALCGIYPTLNKDLLYAGIILHDIGKVFELSGPIATTYTVEGNLIGHISIMVTEISKTAEELEIDGEEVMLLQHLVLSHHGKEEWGSPKRPMIKEAEILHYIDNIDAKMMMLDRALGKTKAGEFSERLFALDNRSFYKPTI
ncbi:3'-5' exoribonuclease YhaM [Planococcus sp. N028]|uniref:3'-5' exoribonuclease YhaM n=1 Tax=Planococcus shixiaomingii TaxID=3058393 RepID=A0ABT8N6F4_9BACL|nr:MULTISPECIES: 3'-5' exoribonuclease YhaM [unclassified Planococcus (in: firmicutes)]MDN7243456.1 3'-5' exoribonuclease YhaM [Planococcus sp. N028]WKA55901.1 3'-5' exoribonuclease YhaM [Planococcus sp. N022]